MAIARIDDNKTADFLEAFLLGASDSCSSTPHRLGPHDFEDLCCQCTDILLLEESTYFTKFEMIAAVNSEVCMMSVKIMGRNKDFSALLGSFFS